MRIDQTNHDVERHLPVSYLLGVLMELLKCKQDGCRIKPCHILGKCSVYLIILGKSPSLSPDICERSAGKQIAHKINVSTVLESAVESHYARTIDIIHETHDLILAHDVDLLFLPSDLVLGERLDSKESFMLLALNQPNLPIGSPA